MIQSKFTLFLALVAFGGVSAHGQVVDASSPTKVVLRSGKLITCHPGEDCSEETIDGRLFYVMQTPQMVVKVAVEPDSKYSHITVYVENRGGFSIQLVPAAFRIEATQPKFKRFSYIEPKMLKLPQIKTPKPESTSARGSSFMGASHESEADRRTFMYPSPLGPSGTTFGDVYFERADNSSTMSLLLPISGTVFEFPYAPSK
jgi:hypothetical protein